MQNIAKMDVFCSFSKGSLGQVLKSWLKLNKFQSFQLILPIVNLSITFVKEQRNLSKFIILPSWAEDLHTAKQGNDLKWLYNTCSDKSLLSILNYIILSDEITSKI